MQKLKACLHLHTKGDKKDPISYSPEEAIKKAKKLGFNVVSITCHDTVLFTEELKEFASNRGILLIPGIEKTIEGKHVLIINADLSAEKIETFSALADYKKAHPETLIIAPHPFHPHPLIPHPLSLGRKLIENIDLFDAIEHNSYTLSHINMNKKAEEIAHKHGKSLIATSDVHNLKYLDKAYMMVESEKETSKFIEAIKQGKTRIISTPLTYFELLDITFNTVIRLTLKNLLRKRSMLKLEKEQREKVY